MRRSCFYCTDGNSGLSTPKCGVSFWELTELNKSWSPTPPPWHCGPTRAMASSFLRFLDHTQRRITVGRTPLNEWSARHRDLYLTTHNTHNRQTSMPPAGFEPTISAGERPQTYALDSAGSRSRTFPKLEYVTEHTRVNLARFMVRHVWFKHFFFCF